MSKIGGRASDREEALQIGFTALRQAASSETAQEVT
jgi:hypothetical protein